MQKQAKTRRNPRKFAVVTYGVVSVELDLGQSRVEMFYIFFNRDVCGARGSWFEYVYMKREEGERL